MNLTLLISDLLSFQYSFIYFKIQRKPIRKCDSLSLNGLETFLGRVPTDLFNWFYALTVYVFSARQHICYSALYAIARPSVRLSVRPSVRHTGGSVKDV